MSKCETTVGLLLHQATNKLLATSDTPALDARVLLAFTLQKDTSWLYAWPEIVPEASVLTHFSQLLTRRAQGEPIAHLTGKKDFWSMELAVNSRTLIPRPETELLVETVLALFDNQPIRLLDLGTGTGAIALALAKERPDWHVVATDFDPDIIKLAATNANNHNLANIFFYVGSWFDALPSHTTFFDIIVSNPPYICEQDQHLYQGDLRYEPRPALTSGPSGLDAIRKIIDDAPLHLKPHGSLLLEHAFNQATMVTQLLKSVGFINIKHLRDLNQHERITYGFLK